MREVDGLNLGEKWWVWIYLKIKLLGFFDLWDVGVRERGVKDYFWV